MDNFQVSINLPVQFVNVVLAALAKQPYEAVAQAYASIQAQAQAQINAAQKPKIEPPAAQPSADPEVQG